MKLVRMRERAGLIKSRMAGFDQVTGDVAVFLDAHCEVNVGECQDGQISHTNWVRMAPNGTSRLWDFLRSVSVHFGLAISFRVCFTVVSILHLFTSIYIHINMEIRPLCIQ